jgi:hypothetical protein
MLLFPTLGLAGSDHVLRVPDRIGHAVPDRHAHRIHDRTIGVSARAMLSTASAGDSGTGLGDDH